MLQKQTKHVNHNKSQKKLIMRHCKATNTRSRHSFVLGTVGVADKKIIVA